MPNPAGPFYGLSAFPITPADADGRVDTTALCRLIEPLVAAGVDSVGLLGSTGTYAYLTRAERRRAVDAAVGAVAGRTKLIVGVGAMRTDEAQHLARDAEAAGADGLLLAPVSYTPLTDEEVFQHFTAVAGAAGVPLCIYNNPSTTHFTFGTDLVQRLASVPGIAAIKNPAPAPAEAADALASLRPRVPAAFALGYAADWNCPAAMLAGADTWYSVAAGFLPGPTLALCRAAQAGDAAEVIRRQARFAPLWSLFRAHGSVRVFYAAAQALGLCDAAPPRPLLPLSPDLRAQVEAALSAAAG